jgi:monoamine oxidase
VLDAVVIGAGAAGIAAARTFAAEGWQVEILEARDRIGGRAHTTAVAGHPVDVGAHWVHVAEANPVTGLLRDTRTPSRLTPSAYPVYENGQLLRGRRRSAMWKGWEMVDVLVERKASGEVDRPLSECMPTRGEWAETVAFNIALYCGAPLEELSARDYNRNQEGGNRFVAGGLGAFIASLAKDIPVRLNCAATLIRNGSGGVRVETGQGPVAARACVVTVPVMVLAAGAIAFDPPLPEPVTNAMRTFRPGAYEHVVIEWPASPFHENGPDQLTFFRSGPVEGGCMLTCIEGTDLHYFEIGGPHRLFWRDGSPAAKIDFLRRFLRSQFGAAADAVKIAHVTDWWNDPLSRGSWSTCAPGDYGARNILRDFAGGRIRFAGEALSLPQPSTVGGAWMEGERAARFFLDAAIA